MKYSIIFCLVFALIYSKVELNKYKSFAKIAKNLLFNNHKKMDSDDDDYNYDDDDDNYDYNDRYDYDDYDDYDDNHMCRQRRIKDTCVAQSLSGKEMECCFLEGSIKYTRYDRDVIEDGSFCQMLPKEVDDAKEIIKLKQTKELVKEVYAFAAVNGGDMPDTLSASGTISCPNIKEFKQDISISLTRADKNKSNRKNHCFYPIYKSIYDRDYDYDDDDYDYHDEDYDYDEDDDYDYDYDIPPSIDDDEKCEERYLREDSKNAGIECGYLKVDATIKGRAASYKTCFPFNKEFLNKITKLKLIDEYKDQYLDKRSDRIKVEFYNAKGSKVTYDTNKSIFLSNNLLLLFFILTLF